MKKVLLALLTATLCATAQPKTIGIEAPLFSLKDETGTLYSLEEFQGKKSVVLVFYPGDNTPVCTKQLCELRDSYTAVTAEKDVVVFGVNKGTAESHKAFKAKNNYPFSLLVDEKGSVAKEYGLAKGSMVARHVFVVGKNGKIIYSKKGKPPVSEIIAAAKKK